MIRKKASNSSLVLFVVRIGLDGLLIAVSDHVFSLTGRIFGMSNMIARTLAGASAALVLALAAPAALAQGQAPKYKKIPPQITTPGKVDSKIGTLTFKDGYPTKATARKLADELDYLHGVQAFKNSIQGVSLYAIRKGFLDIGIRDNDVLITSRLLSAKSLLLTGNADTVYIISFLDLSKGPLVVEVAPGMLGIFDDM